jgi:hypothetical protein
LSLCDVFRGNTKTEGLIISVVSSGRRPVVVTGFYIECQSWPVRVVSFFLRKPIKNKYLTHPEIEFAIMPNGLFKVLNEGFFIQIYLELSKYKKDINEISMSHNLYVTTTAGKKFYVSKKDFLKLRKDLSVNP